MRAYFDTAAHRQERQQLPILSSLIERYRDERPFAGMQVASGHVLVRNSMVTIEALYAGGAEIVLADAFQTPATETVKRALEEADVPIYSKQEAAHLTDLYLDVNAVLGREQAPLAAAEVTRTGIHHYANIEGVVISADDCRSKLIEGFYGTGDSLRRAWRQFKGDEGLTGKRIIQFGFGKIGRGVAFQLRLAEAELLVLEADPARIKKAEQDGFDTLNVGLAAEVEKELKAAEIIVSVTGIPGIISDRYSRAVIMSNAPELISLGAQDEYGDDYGEDEILGGKQVPLNFQLAEPTLNRYVDAPLAAHVLALEAWARNPDAFENGIHALPEEMDRWVLESWREYWPNEDLTGIGADLGLS